MSIKRKVINIILIIIIIFSGYKIIYKIIDYKKADTVYDDIRSIKEDREIKMHKQGNKIEKSHLDLSDINKDYRGWIGIEGTNIDYPVVQSNDNTYYLKKDINKNYLPSGSIFLDFRNNNFEDENTVIYGHYMRNNTMFGELKNFKNKEFFDKDNKINIEIAGGKILEYEIFSVYTTDSSDNYITTSFNSQDEYKQFLDKVKDKSLHKTNLDVNTDDKILTLSTCSYEYEDARTVIHAKLMSEKDV